MFNFTLKKYPSSSENKLIYTYYNTFDLHLLHIVGSE